MKISKKKEEFELNLTFTDDVIKERIGKYGAVYFSADIKESVEDILGNEVKKELLDDFFKALIKYDEFMEQLKKTKLKQSVLLEAVLQKPLFLKEILTLIYLLSLIIRIKKKIYLSCLKKF